MNLNYRKTGKNDFLRRDDMKIISIVFFSVIFTVMPFVTYAQETRTLDGVQYTIIDPETYAFNADTGRLRVGERYVIDGQVSMISGATLNLRNAGGLNNFILNSPLRLSFGANITVYAEISSVTSYGVEARIVKLEGPGISSAQIQPSTGTRSLDGIQYQIITPEEYSFNAASRTLRVGQRYVIDGQVSTISGATLSLRNAGVLSNFILDSPLRLSYGTNITVYAEIISITSYSVEARVIKVEER